MECVDGGAHSIIFDISFQEIESSDRINILYGDLNDYSSLLKVLQRSSPNYIFHLAAQSYPQTSFDSPIDTLNYQYSWNCSLT